MMSLSLGDLLNLAYSESANLALLGAIGVIGYQLYALERRYNNDKKKRAFDEAKARETVVEGKLLLERMKSEGVRVTERES